MEGENHNIQATHVLMQPQNPSTADTSQTAMTSTINNSSSTTPVSVGVTDALLPPSDSQSIGVKHPGNSTDPGPGPTQVNHGWAPSQTRTIVVYQPLPNTMIVTDPANQVPNYLSLSICVSLCCCVCLGICAIVKSLEAKRLRDIGRIAEAKSEAKGALITNIIGIIIGVIIISIYFALRGANASVGY